MFSYIDWYVSVSSLAIYHWFPFFAHFDVIAFEFDVRSTPWRLIIDFSRVKLIKIQLKPNISVDSNALKSHSVKKLKLHRKKFSPLEKLASTTSSKSLRNVREALKVKGESTTHSSNLSFFTRNENTRCVACIYKEPFLLLLKSNFRLSDNEPTIRLLVNLFTCVLYFYCASFCSFKLFNCAS